MSEDPKRRHPGGRPPLDPHDPSVHCHVSVPSKTYDRLDRVARVHGLTIPEVLRRMIRHTLDDTPRRDRS